MLDSQKQTTAPSRRYALHGGFSFSYSLLLLYLTTTEKSVIIIVCNQIVVAARSLSCTLYFLFMFIDNK